jgi:flavin reductase (DIM6/NTAB) family NADH-FMN oxidoreductase RutF
MIQKAVISADNNWIEKNLRQFKGSPIQRIGEEWMLITSGNTQAGPGNWNTMTVSWGGFGVLWGKDVVFTFIRPGRHTRTFMEANSLYSLSFFDKEHHKALAFCGEKSGRDYDKAMETGLTPIVFGHNVAGGRAAGVVAFKEATDVIICRKIYTQDLDPANFLDSEISGNYPQKDYHRIYVGEALALLTAK